MPGGNGGGGLGGRGGLGGEGGGEAAAYTHNGTQFRYCRAEAHVNVSLCTSNLSVDGFS